MKTTLLGSLGNINKHTVPRLVADGHDVTVITSSPERVAAIEALGAKALVGSMSDSVFLTHSLRGSDVVYLMISGAPAGDLMESVKNQAEIFKMAVHAAEIKNVVLLSSIGAQNPDAGILYMYHYTENALSSLLSDINLAIIRPVGFYNNLFGDLQTIKTAKIIYSSVPADVQRKWVDPSDIAELQYQFLTALPAGKTIKYVVSDTASGNDWLDALKENGLEVNYQLISDDAVKENLLKAGFSEANAENYMKMSAAQRRPDAFYEDIEKIGFHQGKVKLADFAKIFAGAYKVQ